jgi:hypothetical protein
MIRGIVALTLPSDTLPELASVHFLYFIRLEIADLDVAILVSCLQLDRHRVLTSHHFLVR